MTVRDVSLPRRFPIDRGDWPESDGVIAEPAEPFWFTPCTEFDVGVLAGWVGEFGSLGREARMERERRGFVAAGRIADTLTELRVRVVNAVTRLPPVEAVAELRRALELPGAGPPVCPG